METLTPTPAPGAPDRRSESPRSEADDDDSDGPLSPEFAHTKDVFARAQPAPPGTVSPEPDRVLRAWSPGKTARAAARENSLVREDSAAVSAVLATEGLSPIRVKRVRGGGMTHDERIALPEAEVYDSDSDDDDGYARGTVFSDEEHNHAEEEDDLFITPSRSDVQRGRYAASPTAAGLTDDGRATFDPVLALLDDNWHLLGLDDVDSPSASPTPKEADELPDHLAPIADHLRALVRDGAVLPPLEADARSDRRVRAELDEAERQLMEALRDADELDASRERYARECDVLRAQLRAKDAKVERLTRENEMAAREIAVITEGLATLTATHDVDGRINDLLIADQQEEIRHLKKKLELERCRTISKAASDNGSEIPSRSTSPADSPIASPVGSTGSIGRGHAVRAEEEEFDGSTTRSSTSSIRRTASSPRSIGRRKSSSTSSASSTASSGKRRSQFRAKERKQLVQRKEDMFNSYQKRHSVSLQEVARRSSMLSISSRNRATRAERKATDRAPEEGAAVKSKETTRPEIAKRPEASS